MIIIIIIPSHNTNHVIIIKFLQDCVFSSKQPKPAACLQRDVFLWEGNNYPCYDDHKREHDTAQQWFCKSCAKPGDPGMLQRCPFNLLHRGKGLQYPVGHPYANELKPVYLRKNNEIDRSIKTL
jgi:hypothetical protein